MNKTVRGFSLIELMVVVAIVGIIGAIALPGYKQYVYRSNRNVGKADLLELQQWMERNYTLTNSYATLPDGTALTSAAWPYKQSSRTATAPSYNISFTATPTATAYTLQAIPANAQTGDTSCGTLTISSAGVRTASGTSGNTTCWNQ